MGKTKSPEHRAAISASLKEHNAKNPETAKRRGEHKMQEAIERLASENHAAITHKVCTKCGERKPLDEFTIRRDHLKCGLIYVRPEASCRKCCAERNKRAAERRKAEGREESSTERSRRWRAKKTPKQKKEQREKDRERQAIRRRKEGIPPRNFRKPRAKSKRVPIEPASVLVEVLLAEGHTKREIALQSGVTERRIYDMEHCASPHTELDNVDKILVAFERQEDLDELYPPDPAPEKLVGYAVLDPKGILKSTES